MATHDAAAGTGGLDASIMFELDRAENPGSAFNNTFGFFSNFYTTRAGAADLLAMAVVIATGSCGGLEIPFRAGRIDATEAGPLGVPEPQQDINTHINRFATAGFNVSDMISMVACGHTLGGVHDEDFPNITGSAAVGGVSHFEGNNGSFAKFDNVVVTQYLDGSTENPLVVGSNDTTNSDKRVFGADGNETMSELADATTFQTKCADILGRMIDTVPSTITLSDPIDAIDIKPYITALSLNTNGTIDFQGRIRVRVSSDTGRDYSDLAVHLTYVDRNGVNSTQLIQATRATFQGGLSSGLFGEAFAWHEFSTVVNPESGISGFHVHLTTISTNETVVFDNEGHNFPVNDGLLFQLPQSCLNSSSSDTVDLTIVAAIRNDRSETAVSLELVHKVPRQGVVLDTLEVRPVAFEQTDQSLGNYTLFKVQAQLAAASWFTTFDIVSGSGSDEVRVDGQKTGLLASSCQNL